jgi:hypothetical protein
MARIQFAWRITLVEADVRFNEARFARVLYDSHAA